jgi:enterochelin esterase-like enzyme
MNNRLLRLLALCAAPWMLAAGQPSSNPAQPAAADLATERGTQSSPTNSGRLIVHRLASEYQTGTNDLLVLLPDELKSGRRYPVLYLLPVYAGDKHAADAMNEARRLDLPNRHDLICVAPAFERLPWYADHAQDPRLRQESHLLKAVLPFVERQYPALTEARGRLLVGFSKSGWGAFSLLLRHPEVFGRAASWDAPLLMEQSGKYGSGPIFGTQENFEQYCITRLLAQQAESLRRQPARLVLLGHGGFVEDDTLLHQRMELLGIPHYWDHGPKRTHDWHSGWVEVAVGLLLRESLEAKSPP